MGAALKVVHGTVTAPGASPVAVTAAVGDSLVVLNARLDSKVLLLSLWAQTQAAGIVQLRSPRLHDNVRGIRSRVVSGLPQPLLPYRFQQALVPQDQLILELAGSAVGGQIESVAFLAWYEDLLGVAGRFIGEGELMDRMVNIVGNETSHAPGAGGGYQGEVALNSSFDLLKANTDYAILGYQVSADCCSLGIRGPDTGNVRIGMPGTSVEKHFTRNYFVELARSYQMPLIPVIASPNKAATLLDVVTNQAAAAVVANLFLAELRPKVGV